MPTWKSPGYIWYLRTQKWREYRQKSGRHRRVSNHFMYQRQVKKEKSVDNAVGRI